MALIGEILNAPSSPLVGGPDGFGYTVGWAVSGGDVVDGGYYSFVGTVAIAGTPDVPVSRRVALYDSKRKVIVRETWSDAEGNFSFDYIRSGPWFVVCDDYTLQFNGIYAGSFTLPLLEGSLTLRLGDIGSILWYYNGSTWVSGRLKRWDGSAWVLV